MVHNGKTIQMTDLYMTEQANCVIKPQTDADTLHFLLHVSVVLFDRGSVVSVQCFQICEAKS